MTSELENWQKSAINYEAITEDSVVYLLTLEYEPHNIFTGNVVTLHAFDARTEQHLYHLCRFPLGNYEELAERLYTFLAQEYISQRKLELPSYLVGLNLAYGLISGTFSHECQDLSEFLMARGY